MDYVKCEAMQKALQRVTNSRADKADAIWKSNLDAMRERECGRRPSPLDAGYSTAKKLAWYDCTRAMYSREYDNLKIAQEEALSDFDAKAKRIKADYEAEGCY